MATQTGTEATPLLPAGLGSADSAATEVWAEPRPQQDVHHQHGHQPLLSHQQRGAGGDNGSVGIGNGYGATAVRRADPSADADADADADAETVSALGEDANGQTGDGGGDDDDDHDKIPGWQVFWLCLARLVEPLAFFSIFPYVSQMAQRAGDLDDADVGFYAGIIESLFSLTQSGLMLQWGRASDRVGRRPVLLVSLAGVSLSISIFGMASTIPQMVLFRCAGGVFAGAIVTIRTMLAEHSTPRTQARIFSWFSFSGNLGIVLGPLLGGALADPAEQYGGVFRRVRLFVEHPYALASLTVGVVGVVATVACACFVKETLPRLQRERDEEEEEREAEDDPKDDAATLVDGEPGVHAGNSRSSSSGIAVQEANGAGEGSKLLARRTRKAAAHEPELSIRELFGLPGVAIVMYNYGYLALLACGYTAIIPVWWFTSIELGGFGFSYLQISSMLTVNGIAQALWLLVVFPPMQRRVGSNGVMRLCAAAYPFFFVIAPVSNALLRRGHVTAFWLVFPPALVVACGVSMSFTAAFLIVNEVSPSPRVLASLSALSLMVASIVRAFAPGIFASLYAVGARTQLLGGYAVWLLMFFLACFFYVLTTYLPDYDELKRQSLARRAAAAAEADGR